MEALGLIKRKKGADPKKKNVVLVEMTAKGKQILEMPDIRATALDILGTLEPSERQELIRLLEKLQQKAVRKIKDLQPLPYALKGKT